MKNQTYGRGPFLKKDGVVDPDGCGSSVDTDSSRLRAVGLPYIHANQHRSSYKDLRMTWNFIVMFHLVSSARR